MVVRWVGEGVCVARHSVPQSWQARTSTRTILHALTLSVAGECCEPAAGRVCGDEGQVSAWWGARHQHGTSMGWDQHETWDQQNRGAPGGGGARVNKGAVGNADTRGSHAAKNWGTKQLVDAQRGGSQGGAWVNEPMHGNLGPF